MRMPSPCMASVMVEHVLTVEEQEQGRVCLDLLGHDHADAPGMLLEGEMKREWVVTHSGA